MTNGYTTSNAHVLTTRPLDSTTDWLKLKPTNSRLADTFSVVSRISEEETNDPCIAQNREPPNTPATPSMWNGCIRMLCSAWKTSMKLNVPEIPRGMPSEKEPCPIGYTMKTAVAATTGAE